MNLLGDTEKASYVAALDDLHDTFARDIVVVTQVKVPQETITENSDDYDFTLDSYTQADQFVIQENQTTIKARIKYLEQQEIQEALVGALRGTQIQLLEKFGVIRIKVKICHVDLINNASQIIVDDNSCKIVFRDRPHGLFAGTYATFFLERTQ